MEIKGEVTDIVFKNEVNGYLIARFEILEFLYTNEVQKRKNIAIVGYIPFVNVGDTLIIKGEYIEHKEYGKQIKVETFKKLMPETLDALEKYLSNGNVTGIGPKLAKKIIEKFGDDTINVLRTNPHKLSQIKGVTEKRAEEMSASFIENWEIWQIVGVLNRFGIGIENAKRAFEELGINAISEIEKNPYILIDISKNIDFQKIDMIAIKLGIEKNNYERVKYGIKYILLRNAYNNGHSCLLLDELINISIDMLNVEKNDLEDLIVNLVLKNEVVIEKRDSSSWIYLYSFNQIENEIAKRIHKLQKSNNVKRLKDIDKKIEGLRNKSNIELSKKQKEAIKLINDNNVTVITGGPGTRKNNNN